MLQALVLHLPMPLVMKANFSVVHWSASLTISVAIAFMIAWMDPTRKTAVSLAELYCVIALG